jgi:hypothetical protein
VFLGDLRKRCRFQPKVHLDLGRLLQRLRHLDRPQPPAGGHEALLQMGNEIHRLDIVGEALAHAGAHHLDGHLLAALGVFTSAGCTWAIEAAAIGAPKLA